MQHHDGGWAEVIENGSCFFKEQGQVIFNACSRNAISNIFVNTAFGRVAFQQLTPTLAKKPTRILVHRELAPRKQSYFRNWVQTTLAVGIKGTDRIDFVVE